MSAVVRGARVISGVGLGAVSGLHAMWAAGSHWPAGNRRALSEAVIGEEDSLPPGAVTATMAGVLGASGLVTAGAFGNGPGVVRLRRLIGVILLVRAAFGGDLALALLGRPPAGERFLHLDNAVYRPLCAVLGVAAILGAKRRRPRREDPAPR